MDGVRRQEECVCVCVNECDRGGVARRPTSDPILREKGETDIKISKGGRLLLISA